MRVILIGTAIAVFASAIFLVRPAPIVNLDDSVCDILTGWASRGAPSGKVTIVEIDESSLAEFGRWPWPRDLLGKLVSRILDAGAATVVLDSFFATEDRGVPSPVRPQAGSAASTNDEALAGVLRGNPVVIGYAFRFDASSSDPAVCQIRPLAGAVAGPESSAASGFFHPSGALCNAPQVYSAASDAGFMNAVADGDGKVRTLPLVMQFGNQLYPSLALAAFDVFLHGPDMQLRLKARESSWLRVGTETVPLEGRSSLRLRFRGPGRTFPYVSATHVLNGAAPAERLRGRIVIIGGSALGLPNPEPTPMDPQFPDVEIQATAVDNLLQDDPLHRPGIIHLWETLLALCAGLGATFLFARLNVRQCALIVPAGVAGTWVGCAALLSSTGLLFSPLPLTTVLASSLSVLTLLNYKREKQRAERTELLLETERETAREVLRESESRYRRLVENIDDAIIVDDAEERPVFVNQRFREWFGIEGRDIREMVLEDCVAPEWRVPLREWRKKRSGADGVANRFEFEGIRADGSRIHIEALTTDVIEDGRIAGTQWALRDITARKLIEAQYFQSQKMEIVGRLAGGVAHDFNNLLQIINGYADMLMRFPPDGDGYRDGLGAILAAGQRAADLTRKLLTFSRKEPVRAAVVNLNDVVAEAVKMGSRLIGEDIELATRLSPALRGVIADSSQIHQILMNLLVNARDAMPGGGRIAIETRNIEPDEGFLRRHPGFPPVPWVYLGVTDTGSGMGDEVKRHLFEPFFTTKELGKGTGLGLATVYGIVEQSSGRIEVTTALGKGTTFHIYFPEAVNAALPSGVDGDKTPLTESSGTVLLVEDQGDVRRFLHSVLEKFGYRILEAANGSDALALAKGFDGTIDLLVTDLVMPRMRGQELAERLMTIRPGTKVLFMSGHAEENAGKRGVEMPDLVYLQKPFSPGQLLAKVRDVLGG
jgi:PAS domain S-box-containing protein